MASGSVPKSYILIISLFPSFSEWNHSRAFFSKEWFFFFVICEYSYLFKNL